MKRNRSHREPARTNSFFEPLEGRQMMSGGALDPTFGTAGVSTLPSGEFFKQWATDLAVQSDGKTVVVGTRLSKDTKNGSTSFFVTRLNADGKIDRTFNGQGFNATNFGRARDLRAS